VRSFVALHRGRGFDAPQLVPVHRRIAEVGRSSSGSEKLVLCGEWVESPAPPEAGGREPSHERTHTRARKRTGPKARKRRGPHEAKGRRFGREAAILIT